jgi:hypothetical protein
MDVVLPVERDGNGDVGEIGKECSSSYEKVIV